MWFFLRSVVTSALLLAGPVYAHDLTDHPNVVIDTDMGLDDVVTLAMVLQNPDVNILGIVASEGVAGPEKSVEHLERMLDLFNRREIPLYAPAKAQPAGKAPPFRPFAESAVSRLLPEGGAPFHRPFSPDAYVTENTKTVVLVLGPLTNLAAALREKPDLKRRIAEVIVAGSPDPHRGWNIAFDPDALAMVQASVLPMEFIISGPAARKPDSWRRENATLGRGTSLGQEFLNRLFADAEVHKHYAGRLENFHDELVFLYYADSDLFVPTSEPGVFAAGRREEVIRLFKRFISSGRQGKARVVFTEGVLPDGVLQRDIRERKAGIITRNGEDEWFAQLLMNELHEHLGVYSVLGVKMGLRAAELLNAPPHTMQVVSHTAAEPPISCLNDGVIVATGCTPGRGLFRHLPGPPGAVGVSFTYQGRRITLALKERYRKRIGAQIAALLETHSLADEDYWAGVRRLGLEVWENWHRLDLFEIVALPDVSGD